jgi:hypothetical protein
LYREKRHWNRESYTALSSEYRDGKTKPFPVADCRVADLAPRTQYRAPGGGG